MNTDDKKRIIIIGSLVLIIFAAAGWIYYTQFAASSLRETLHEGVGMVLAQETVTLLNKTGQIVVVTMDGAKAPELKPQMEAFLKKLKRTSQIKIKEQIVLDTEGKSNYGAGMGLSSRRFLRLVKKNAGVDAIVSFEVQAGIAQFQAPSHVVLGRGRAEFQLLQRKGLLQRIHLAARVACGAAHPDRIKKLFDKNVMQVAIVSRFEFPAPGKHNPRSPNQWFEKRFQVVTGKNAKDLPAHGGD